MNLTRKMKTTAFIVAFSLLFVTCLSGLESGAVYAAEDEKTKIAGEYAENEILVVFEDDINEKEAKKVVEDQNGEEFSVLDTLQDEVAGVVELPEEQTVEEAVSEYERDPDIAYAQPNYKYKLAEEIPESGRAESLSATTQLTDEDASKLWHLDTVQVQEAWERMEGKVQDPALVAVLDTGVDMNHPDLQINMRKDLCKDTSDGKTVKPLTGDGDGHGTHVFGIIGATANNEKGVAGVASGPDNSFCELFAVDIFRGEYAYTDGIIMGIQYAIQQKADVINISAGYASSSVSLADILLENAVSDAVSAGVTVVCAAGNDGNTVPNYPADFTACISVISTGRDNKKASSSNYGAAKDIAAPGDGIYSTYYIQSSGKSSYDMRGGTSMASPVVAGTAALLYALEPDITVSRVKNILYNSATDIYSRGWDSTSGYGIVNANKAVAMEQNAAVVKASLNKTSLRLSRGSSASLSVSLIPSEAPNQQVTWASSNPSVVTVSASGKVTAKSSGSAVITVRSTDEFKASDSCSVIVPYTIAYKLNGGKNNAANPSSYYGKLTLKNPTRRKYTFVGWYKDSAYRSKVSVLSGGNQTLYAKWKKVKVSKSSIRSLKQKSSRKIKVRYKKISGAAGYQIAYSTKKSFKKRTTKYKTTRLRTKTLTKLKKGKTYYVKVRAYKIDSAGKKVYGKYSKVKKIKLK